MRFAIRAVASAGLPIYAECGGLIYLTEAVVDANGQSHPLVGLLSGRAVMTPRVTLGYRVMQAIADSWLWRAGESMRGHEFHYSVWEHATESSSWLYEIQPDTYHPQPQLEGAQIGNVLASYIHLHFLAMPSLATRFVEAARASLPITPPITQRP
jgi:cobyrinic acid a,c-diamide synthase